MRFLIDGYNMMHLVGYLSGPTDRYFSAARTRFLNWLADIAKQREATIRVVFDAVNAPEQSQETRVRGVFVRFAYGLTADDEIERLLLKSDDAIVVTNDTRLHESARRAKRASWSCQEFLDWTLCEVVAAKLVVEVPEKSVDANEDAKLLAAFLQPREPVR